MNTTVAQVIEAVSAAHGLSSFEAGDNVWDAMADMGIAADREVLTATEAADLLAIVADRRS